MTSPRPRQLAHASLLLALLAPPAHAASSLEAIVYVEYDATAPLDPTKSYGCLADVRRGAGSASPRQLTCTKRVPMAELCGTDSGGQLPADCPFIPGSTGAGTPPTAAQVTSLADALLQYFQGNQPKLNFAARELGSGGRAAYEMNLQPGAPGASPSVGAWNEASSAERNVRPTALQVDDPDPADARFGNTAWNNPAADPAEWNALLSAPTLDHVERASRNLLATPSAPNPPAAAVTARATSEVARCRGDSLDLLRADIEWHLSRAAGGSGTRPAGSVRVDCLADPGPPASSPPPPLPPPPPPPPPPPTYTACDGTVHATQAAADAVTCSTPNPIPPPTYTACDGTTHATLAAAQAVDCSSDPDPDPEPEPTQTCWDGSEIPTSESCPSQPDPTPPAKPDPDPGPDPEPEPEPEPEPTQTCWDGSEIAASESCPSEPAPTPSITCWDGSTVEDAGDCPTPDYGGGGDDDDDNSGGNTGGGGGDDPDPDPLPVTGDPICTVGECEGEDPTTVVSDPDPEPTFDACDGSTHSSQADAAAVICPDPDPAPGDMNDCPGPPLCIYGGDGDDELGWF